MIIVSHGYIVYVKLRHLTSGYEVKICARNFLRKLTNQQQAPTGPSHSQTCCVSIRGMRAVRTRNYTY